MKSMLYGLAALPFLAGIALAQQPMQLSDQQMDKVTAGWDASISEESNTSVTAITVYNGSALALLRINAGNPTAVPYIDIETNGMGISVASCFGPKC